MGFLPITCQAATTSTTLQALYVMHTCIQSQGLSKNVAEVNLSVAEVKLSVGEVKLSVGLMWTFSSATKITMHSMVYIYRLYGESMEIRDLETLGPWAVASERSEDAIKGPRVSKSRISIGRAV